MKWSVEASKDPPPLRWWGERVHVVLNGWCIWFRRLEQGKPGYESGWWSELNPSDSAVAFRGETSAAACRAAISALETPYRCATKGG